MGRSLRIVYEGAVYHVTVRGIVRRDLFQDDRDRRRVRLKRLRKKEFRSCTGKSRKVMEEVTRFRGIEWGLYQKRNGPMVLKVTAVCALS